MTIRIHFFAYLLAMASLTSVSCSKENSVIQPIHADITLVSSLTGIGDNGYNDNILNGVVTFASENSLELSLKRATSIESVKEIYKNWISDESRLLILAGSEYASIAANADDIPQGKNLLLLESKDTGLPDGTYSIWIARYGVSWLSGSMAQKSSKAYTVCAFPDDPTTKEALNGFTSGYTSHSSGKITHCSLSDSEKGYSMSDSTYRLASKLTDGIVFPLAGGSNSGFYKYGRETQFSGILIIGMDVDCGALCNRVPYSMTIDIGGAIMDWLTCWVLNQKIEKCTVYGLDSGHTDVVASNRFYTDGNYWEDYYIDDLYWTNLRNQYFQDAITKEREYYAQ